jgi:hypothetical protein
MATAASRLSSSRAKARLALWLIAAAVLAALVVGYLVVDRGGNSRRDAVAAYIERANEVQQGLATRIGTINTAYAQLRLDPKAAARQAPKLADAQRAIGSSRARLAAVSPPTDARVLHERLLRLLELEQSLAADVTDLARHLGVVTTGMRSLALATAQLSKDLQEGATPAEQAAAFRRYSSRLGTESTRLSKLRTPVLLASARRDDVARLARVAKTGDELGAAISAGNGSDVDRLLARLEREVRAAAAIPGGRLFVTAYNRRVRAVAAARVAVETEFRRLDRDL